MVFIILRGCLPYSNDWNILECECRYGTYGSFYAHSNSYANDLGIPQPWNSFLIANWLFKTRATIQYQK